MFWPVLFALGLMAGGALLGGDAIAATGMGAGTRFVTLSSANHERDSVQCLRAVVAVQVDSVPRSDEFVPTGCERGQGGAVYRYDRSSGITRLARAIAAGETVPRFPEFGIDMVRPGQILYLLVVSGPVTIERKVQALQAARPGQRVFVETGDGEIVSARYQEALR